LIAVETSVLIEREARQGMAVVAAANRPAACNTPVVVKKETIPAFATAGLHFGLSDLRQSILKASIGIYYPVD